MNRIKNLLHYAFAVSIFLHLTFLGIVNSVIKPFQRYRPHNLTKITVLSKPDIEKKEETKKAEKTSPGPFSPFENSEPSPAPAGGAARILTVAQPNPEVAPPLVNYPQTDRSEGKGIGLGGTGSGLGVNGDAKGVGLAETSYKPPVDKEKILKEYQTSVLQKIQRNKGYPLRAKKNGIEGKVEVGFTVLSAGNVADIRIISPSGYDVLDGEAVSLIKKCSPFLKIPEPLGRSKIGFGTIIVFKLREK